MLIEKSNNQYYGQYFEEAIVSLINKTIIRNNTNYTFSLSETTEMNFDAQVIAEYLNGKKAEYCGRKTSTANADLIVDGEEIEVKYVSAGTGTYFNTTISYLDSLGFESFHSRLETEDYLTRLKNIFGDKVSLNNNSPISNAIDARAIRASKEWPALEKLEKQIRTKYVSDFFDFLQDNPEKMSQFIYGLLTKENAQKAIPSRIIIFNRKTKRFLEISQENICAMLQNKQIRNAGLSLVFDDFRVAFGWQNGNGLRNPTLRVFLK